MKNRTAILAALCIATVVFAACKSSIPPGSSVPTATSSQAVAQVNVKSGSAEYQAKGTTVFVPAVNRGGISVGDRVRSKLGAQVAVEFLDGSSLVLLENTEIEVQSYEVTRDGERILSRVGRVAVIRGDVSGDVREDLIYPPSVFEIVTSGEIYTVKGTLTK